MTSKIIKSTLILFCAIFIFTSHIQANNAPILNNERFAVNALTVISGAQATFKSSNANFATLQQLHDAGLIDSVLATGEKYGYSFSITIVTNSPKQATGFRVSAVPQRYGRSGRRSFYLDESGVIRGADRGGKPATAEDAPIPINCGETGAIFVIRNISGAEGTYQSSVGNGNYGTLAQLLKIGLIGEYLVGGENCGYLFTVETTPRSENIPATFNVRATPQQYGISGIRSFYIDETGILRGADKGGAAANSDDPPIN